MEQKKVYRKVLMLLLLNMLGLIGSYSLYFFIFCLFYCQSCRYVVNMEACGAGGPEILFQAGAAFALQGIFA
jgi:hypothetical protein